MLLFDLGVPAGRIAFFDDTPINVEAARAAGIAASRVDGFAALEARLDDLGIIDRNHRRRPSKTPLAEVHAGRERSTEPRAIISILPVASRWERLIQSSSK